ncbi:MAG TPA: Flp pilus assembly protein CpaB [Candidatus Acidoferrales bacterium]|jgi:pilus assembly protein CpaB|nr:Flp pilus assembly protein CpaB [Candidatus Acidoferrales bacterium]
MKRPIVFVILAGMGAILAAIVVFSALNKRESEVQRAMARTIEVVVASNDIPVGTKLAPASVKLVRWSRDSLPQGVFTDPQTVAGSFAKSEFVANEPIVASKLFMGQTTSGVMPLMIPAGMRAMSVPVDEVSDIAGFVAPHTRVDILVAVAGTGPGEPSFSRIVLQNIEVLAVAQEIEHIKDEPEVVKVVTLLVTPPDAEKLTLASREGLLRLAMRNYSDSKIVATRGIGLPDLLHQGEAAGATLPVMQIQPAPGPALSARSAHIPTAFRIEVMRDGRSSEAMTFVHSGTGSRSSFQAHQDAPAVSEPQMPATPAPPDAPPLPDAPETPVSSARPVWSASFAEPPESAFAAVRRDKIDGHVSTNLAPLRPGDPGYEPAPKTYQVP